jgi:CheY-like chemotaxis protein
LRILVVDDCRDTVDTVAMLLRMWGHDVRSATSGPAALAIVADYAPDVVLLDIGLPGMDGYQVARRLREEVGLRHALLVSVSGYADPKDRQQSHLAGCDHHLIKPVEPESLRLLLASWAARHQPHPAEPMRGTT